MELIPVESRTGSPVAPICANMGVLLISPEATELAKLTETTYFGLMIAWAQELERYCDKSGANYDELVAFYEEIKFFPPVKYTSGIIGGHCVMPNIEILRRFDPSNLLEAIRISNQMKVERDAHKGIAPTNLRRAQKLPTTPLELQRTGTE